VIYVIATTQVKPELRKAFIKGAKEDHQRRQHREILG
jgi:hypothetical protein